MKILNFFYCSAFSADEPKVMFAHWWNVPIISGFYDVQLVENWLKAATGKDFMKQNVGVQAFRLC